MADRPFTILVSPGGLAASGDAIRAAGAEAGFDVRFVVLPAGRDERLDPATCADIDAALQSHEAAGSHSAAFADAIANAPRISWVHSHLAGTDAPLYDPIRARGIRLTSSAGANAEPLAHTAIGGLLILARNFLPWIANQRESLWKSAGPMQPDLRGQVMTVFGFGAIGKNVGRVAQALGLHVIGVRRSPRGDDDPVDEMVAPADLGAVLPRTDWLVITAPLTPETEGIIDAAALASMPHGSRLINVSRGAIVDQEAMIAALRSGQLGGAYLDVFPVEPLPSESPLWTLPNVVISPHGASGSPGNAARSAAIFIDNLRRLGRGEAMINVASG
jgi:phosphoglycerate dehydrogenase-like enzyme